MPDSGTAETNADTRRWRSIREDDLLWNDWDGEFVVYHRPSGRTHFVNSASADILRNLLSEPALAAEVAAAYPAVAESSHPDAHVAEITALLERFEHLGLIERA